MTKDYKIIFSTSDNKQREVSMHVPEEIGTYKAAFSLSNNVVITASGNIIVDATERTYNLKFKLSNGNVINAGNFKTKAYVPYVFTVSGAPHNYAVCLSVTAGAVDATVTFAGITKTVPAGTTATVSFTNSDTSVTEGQVEVRNSTAAGCGTFSYTGSDGKSETYNWDAIKTVISYDSTWTALPARFLYNCSITSLPNIPDRITSIGDYAFRGTTGLSNGITNIFSLSNTLESIGNYAFSGSDIAYYNLNLPNTLVSIGEYAFRECANINIITIPDSVTALGAYAFYDSDLRGVTIGNGVQTLEPSVFSGSSLSLIDWGSNIKTIGTQAISTCKSLTKIEVPSSVESIGSLAFSYCSSLSDVTLNVGLKELLTGVFFECSALTFITFKGTKAQWNAITKDEKWYGNPGTLKQINCTDGIITL